MGPKYLVTILVLLALAVPASPAHAGGVVSVCDEAHLRAALAGGDTVTFSCSGTIILTSTIAIWNNTTLDGTGQAVIISGNHAVRVFKVNSGVTLNLNRLTIANGGSGPGGNISGGGILNQGTVTVNNSTFTGNHTGNGEGGGIYNASDGTVTVSNSIFSDNGASQGGGITNDYGTVTVNNSIFSGNSSSNSGGGISNSSKMTVSNSTFSSNRAADGGGISNSSSIELTVSNSTFAGNSARFGGGIYNSSSVLTVSNSTFFGNSADYAGGGIYGEWGAVIVSNSTFAGNSASSGGGIHNFIINTVDVSNSTFSGNSADYGGGIYNNNGWAQLSNTIVANSPKGSNCLGPVTDGGGNLSYPDTTCPGINGDPLLGPLQITIGPTETMALGPGSAAIDAANDATCDAAPIKNLDQRGIARPWGTHCDIGAVEQVPLKRLWFASVNSQ